MQLGRIVCGALVAVGCACGSGAKSTGPAGGSGTGGGGAGDPAACDAVALHVTDLYQANAERTKLTPGEVADNVAMVLGECKTAPGRVAPCAAKATAVTVLERDCLLPLDDQGSEGTQFTQP
ncbi:MAG: hypothetical protein R3B06_19520 [Kofleriaceae bacterium]